MRNLLFALLPLALAACSGGTPAPTAAQPYVASSSRASLGDVVIEASTTRLSALNPAMAKQYAIDTSADGLLFLVTVRDASGNAATAADLSLSASAGVLPDAPQPLPLRRIDTAGLTDYIGVLHAKPPASVQFKLQARRGGASAEIATTTELPPR